MLQNLMKIKRKIYKELSTQLLEWSKEPGQPSLEDILREEEDSGLVLTRKNGILKILVHAKTEEEALNLLVDLVTSNFSDYAYNLLLDKFPNIKNQIEAVIASAFQKLNDQDVELMAAEQNDLQVDGEEEPLVDPLMPRG